MLSASELTYGRHPQLRCNHSIEDAWRSTALDMAQDRRADLETQSLGMFLEVSGHSIGIVLSALGNDDDRVALPTAVSGANLLGNGFGMDRNFRNDDGLGAARDAGDECEVAGVAAHHFDEKNTLVRRRGNPQPVDCFNGDVDRRG